MALPQEPPLGEMLREARARWTGVRASAVNARTLSAGGPYRASQILGLYANLRRERAYFQDVAATPGLGEYAQEQYGAGYTIGPDFAAFQAALGGVIDWISTNMPRDANGFLLVHSIDANGDRVDRTFSSVQTAGLRAALDVLIGTVAPPVQR